MPPVRVISYQARYCNEEGCPRVALALWFLAPGADYRTVGHLFGVSQSTVCIATKEAEEVRHDHMTLILFMNIIS